MMPITIIAATGGTAETTTTGADATHHARITNDRHRPPKPAAICRPRSTSPWNTQTSTS